MPNKIILRRIYCVKGKLHYLKDFSILTGKSPANQQAIASAMEEHSRPIDFEVDGRSVKIFAFSDSKVFVEMIVDEVGAIDYFTNSAISEDPRFESFLKVLDKASEEMLEICKYFFGFDGINEHLSIVDKTLVWINDKWYDCVDRRRVSWMYASPFYLIDNGTLETIHRLLHETARPLKALVFLHKAKQEEDIKYKWIYTATSMELGLVEYLYLKDSSLATTWSAKGSPGFGVMLRDHLPNYLGHKLPEAATLRNNAEVRNNLLHQPGSSGSIKIEDCIAYMDLVERVLFTLLGDLYPTSSIIQERIAKVNNDRTAPGL